LIDLKRLWRLSVFCGLVTKNLAITAGIRDIEGLFVAGLLLRKYRLCEQSNVKLIMLMHYRGNYSNKYWVLVALKFLLS
jgi:hypothetical protein